MDYIKVLGQWKEVQTSYIKVNGHWKASDKQYIKVGGVWADTSNLSATKISYDGTSETRNHSRVLVNTLDPLTHEATMYSGLSISLKVGAKLTIPVPSATASILLYDYNHGGFLQITPAVPEHVLHDMTVGTIVYLDSTKFIGGDIVKFNAVPERIVDWYNGIDVGISIVKGANDKVWLRGKEIGGGTALVKEGHTGGSKISHKDIQLLKLKEDAHGHYISSSTKIEGKDDGRYVKLPMVDPAKVKHLVKTCLSKIECDITQVVDTPCVP